MPGEVVLPIDPQGDHSRLVFLAATAKTPALKRKYRRMLDPRRGAASSLRDYLARAEIPTIARYTRESPYSLPPEGRRTHKNKLKVRHDAGRRLAKIRQHEPKAFCDAIQAYHKKYIHSRRKERIYAGKPYPRREAEALVLKAGDFRTEASYEDIPYPSDMDTMCRWVLERPLQTMARAVHVAFPDTTRWWLDEADTAAVPNLDHKVWRTYLWRFHPDEFHPVWWRDVPDGEEGIETEAAPLDSMVFAVQPSWILGPQDLKCVSECTEFPQCARDGTPPETPLLSEERVWAKLYDTCKALDCRAFVLTNYHGWIFGTFSEDWTSVRTSDVRNFDARAPTVMQSLVYWVAASMNLTGARHWEMPVPDDPEPEAASGAVNVGAV